MLFAGFVKSPFCPLFVIPAKAEIWTPAFAGVTDFPTFYEIILFTDFPLKPAALIAIGMPGGMTLILLVIKKYAFYY